jgi:PAS domain S-box-containing protein
MHPTVLNIGGAGGGPSDDAAFFIEILESFTDGFFVLDREWRFVFASDHGLILLGKTRDALLGRTLWEAFPPVVGTEWDLEYHRAVAENVAVHFEAYYPPFDIWFETHACPAQDRLTIFLRDVSSRRRLRKAAETRARQQAAVARLGLQALAGTALETLHLDLQALFDDAVRLVAGTLGVEYCKVLELEPDGGRLLLRAGVGWKPGAVGHATVLAGERSQAGYTLLSREPVVVEDLRAEPRFKGPALLLDHDVISGMSVVIEGRDRPFGILGAHTRRRQPFTSGDADFLQAMANVLALAVERMQVKESLLESEQQFRQLAENIREVLFMTDATDTNVLYVNPAYEQLWGRSCQSLYDDPASWLEGVHPEDRPRAQAALAHLAEGWYDEEFRLVHPDGAIRWVRDRMFPVRAAGGGIERLVGIAEDVTEQKLAETSLQRLAEEQAARAAAESRVQARDDVLAFVSHDLRTPLNLVAASAQLLEEPLSEVERQRAVRRIRRSAERMDRLIQDLLDVARIEAGRLTIDPHRADAAAIVHEVVESLEPQAREQMLHVGVDIPDDLPPVVVDPDRLQQVLVNLLDNAIKFTPERGRVRVRAARAGRDVRFEVTNTGKPIAPEELASLFQPFWQASRADRRGTGLGLSIVRGLVEAHGGKVSVESDPGSGTTFSFTLPAGAPDP